MSSGQSVGQWIGISVRIALLCGTLFLMCDAIVKTRGVDTKRCFSMLGVAVVLTLFGFVLSRYIIIDSYCSSCGNALSLKFVSS